MALCDGAHAQFDRWANGEIQVGSLPEWTRVRGKVAWYVAQGPLDRLPEAWAAFHRKVGVARPGRPDGPPGEVFACRPEDHAADGAARLVTLLYLPLA